jgi:hypothetical protein
VTRAVQRTWDGKDDFHGTSVNFSYLKSLCHSSVNYMLSTGVNITGTTESS